MRYGKSHLTTDFRQTLMSNYKLLAKIADFFLRPHAPFGGDGEFREGKWGNCPLMMNCAPNRDFKALFFNGFDQNTGKTCKSERYLVEHQGKIS